ncbi:MAG TPA: transglutaminaseTgpA domain-containing protein [Thermoanaerobaculia bacterium]|nr:transglutaminaseTgpA domain-containing protein [Thermoanaerobaculia bacterium]
MTRRAREVELLFAAMFAAVPLYLTQAIGNAPLIAFHAAMLLIAARVAMGKGPAIVPPALMRALAVAYVPLYFIDWIAISHSAIAASTHLVLFIAVYQPIEALQRKNEKQRLLTTALIFVASVATSTHVLIVLFVIAFAFLVFRQLMYASHLESVQSVELAVAEPPSARAALFYVAGATLIGSLLFPLLPRIRNPFVQGITGSLSGASTALSATIDFREPRVTPADATIVARVWMGQRERLFFTPVRLRGTIYDRFHNGAWRQTPRGIRPLPQRDGSFIVGRPAAVQGTAIVQQRTNQGTLYLPVETYSLDGLSSLYEGSSKDTYFTYNRGTLNFEVRMAQQVEPLRLTRVRMTGYPVTPEVAALAQRIVGGETRPEKQAELIEQWMLRNFRYVPNPATPRAMTIEEFLLRERRGHCEYFAAGMVVLLTALEVPARIGGGFYGGRLNPLTGYLTVRRDDAHAWTEVWNGKSWRVYDSTPASLRPGSETPNAWAAYLAAVADSINYFWDRYILTFGLGDQITLFTDLITAARDTAVSLRESVAANARALPGRAFVAFLALLAAAALAVALIKQRRRPLFHLLETRLRAHGVQVEPSMTVEEALRELRARDAGCADELAPLAAMYEEIRFARHADRSLVREMRRRLQSLQIERSARL